MENSGASMRRKATIVLGAALLFGAGFFVGTFTATRNALKAYAAGDQAGYARRVAEIER